MPDKIRSKIMYCVIMGDVINSRKIPEGLRKQLLTEADHTFERINAKYSSSIMAGFGMVRGDAFEGILLTPSQAPVIVPEIIKAFFRIDRTCVRICISLGELTTVGSDRNKADGPAFWDALKGLDELKENQSEHWLQISYKTASIEQPLINSQMKLLTALTEDWTDKQREVSWLMDDYGGDINQIAKKMSILPSVVRKHITAAKYYAYKSVWDSIEEYYVALDEQLTGERPAQGKNYLAYYNAALRKYGQNDFSKAVPLFEKAIKLADQDQDINNEQKAEMYCRMAENYVHYGKSKYKKALEVIEKAKMLQTDLPKARKQYIETLYCESQIYTNKKNREEAVLLLEEALALAVSFLQSNDLFIAVMKNDAAVNYIGLKDYKKAIEHLTDSIRIEEANGFTNTTGYLNHLRNLAFCYEQIGEYHQALQLRHKVKEMHGGKTASGHR